MKDLIKGLVDNLDSTLEILGNSIPNLAVIILTVLFAVAVFFSWWKDFKLPIWACIILGVVEASLFGFGAYYLIDYGAYALYGTTVVDTASTLETNFFYMCRFLSGIFVILLSMFVFSWYKYSYYFILKKRLRTIGNA